MVFFEENEDDDLANRFGHHPPKDEYVKKDHENVRRECYNLSLEFSLLPDSREKSLAITKLEEAMFWANAAIARNQD